MKKLNIHDFELRVFQSADNFERSEDRTTLFEKTLQYK